VTVDRTELEWTYEPTGFFEAPYRHAARDFDLMIDSGTAIANLTVPTDPVPSDLEESVRSFVENTFLVRKLQIHTNYKLEGPRIYQHSSGRKNVSIRLAAVSTVGMVGQVDFMLKDAAGNIIRDSKAERITEHTSLLDLLAPKLQQSATLRGLFDSYSRSVADPNDEFVHLYEVRDALSRHYGDEQLARHALGISKSEWQRVGFLTNEAQVEQSRHRGKHSHGRRPATDEELDEARKLARQWIIAFARTV
jgi:hypothetical protein